MNLSIHTDPVNSRKSPIGKFEITLNDPRIEALRKRIFAMLGALESYLKDPEDEYSEIKLTQLLLQVNAIVNDNVLVGNNLAHVYPSREALGREGLGGQSRKYSISDLLTQLHSELNRLYRIKYDEHYQDSKDSHLNQTKALVIELSSLLQLAIKKYLDSILTHGIMHLENDLPRVYVHPQEVIEKLEEIVKNIEGLYVLQKDNPDYYTQLEKSLNTIRQIVDQLYEASNSTKGIDRLELNKALVPVMAFVVLIKTSGNNIDIPSEGVIVIATVRNLINTHHL